MVGDALGDWKRGQGQRRALLPDRPRPRGRVVATVLRGGPPRFFAGTFAGDYMDAQLARFEALLPELPPWKRA